MTRIELMSFVCDWIVQAVGDLVDLLSLDQIPNRLIGLFSADHRIKSIADHKAHRRMRVFQA